MTKKEKENIKKWRLHFIYQAIASILQKDGYNAGNGGNDTGNGCNYSTEMHHPLSPGLSMETTFVDYNPSFMGYLVAILRLFKQAFVHKKGVHFIVIR